MDPISFPVSRLGQDGVTILNDPFDIAYATRKQPIQTSDWWTGLGLQWSGWVVGRTSPEGNVGRSQGFISEPFQMQFVDVLSPISGLSVPLQGLRFWNQNAIALRTDGKIRDDDPFNPTNNFAGRGEISREDSPEVTVGLANVHPLGTSQPDESPLVECQSEKLFGLGCRGFLRRPEQRDDHYDEQRQPVCMV